jgi:ABC-2 type transport system permease protein
MQEIGRSLRTLWIIFRQEFIMYFVSPIVYLIGAIWLFLAGGFFSLSLNWINQGFGEPSLMGMFSPMVFLMIFIAPALTMRVIAEELRAGTHELLFTAPIRDWEIVVGKWLAVWAVFSIFVLLTVAYPFILVSRGNPDQGMMLTGYLGLWLMGGATLAVGVFASSLTQYQLVSFMITMGILVFLQVSSAITQAFTNPTVAEILRQLSLSGHYQNLTGRALIDPVDIAYFVGMILIFLFLATQSLSMRRWNA